MASGLQLGTQNNYCILVNIKQKETSVLFLSIEQTETVLNFSKHNGPLLRSRVVQDFVSIYAEGFYDGTIF